MIQPLRRRHFWIWVALSVTLVVLFVAGLAVRRTPGGPNPSFRVAQPVRVEQHR
jgi:hypothetical protein